MTGHNARMDVELEPHLQSWIRQATGLELSRAERRVGGTSREAWEIDLAGVDAEVQECFLRREGGAGPQAGTDYSVRREAAIYRALEGRGIAVPQAAHLPRSTR